MKYTLRDYQQEVVDLIDNIEPGKYLVVLATGLGKTVIFSHLKRKGRILVLAHREELLTQAKEKYEIAGATVGIEQAEKTSNGEDIVVASVQSLKNRLDKFDPEEFDMVITDEAHHATAPTYRLIYDYFKPRLNLGFTATPNRDDGQGLGEIYDKIIYQKDLRWGIENDYLVNIEAKKVNIGYDISQVARRMGDYAPGELDKALNQAKLNGAIKEVYKDIAKGKTLIFAVSVEHSNAIAEIIGEEAISVVGDTKNRDEILEKFKNSDNVNCLVSCNVFLEGVDIPNVETIIIARPTSNSSLYTQMVGRGLRLYSGKDKLLLIDLVGTIGRATLCTAPTLIGLDIENVPANKRELVVGDLFELENIIKQESDCIESWITNVKTVDIWARSNNYNLHNLNFFRQPNGELTLNIPKRTFILPKPDLVDSTYQDRIDRIYKDLNDNYKEHEYIWNTLKSKRWANSPASPKQMQMIMKIYKKPVPRNLNKLEASQVLNRLFYRR